MNGRQLLTINEAVVTPKQHTKPCSDCPWARTAAPGWLAGETPANCVRDAHGEVRIDCHTKLEDCEPSDQGEPEESGWSWQCAGAAIYRANVSKLTRDGETLRLPKDKVRVFATSQEFIVHHSPSPKGSS
jgi:hypothetical protein